MFASEIVAFFDKNPDLKRFFAGVFALDQFSPKVIGNGRYAILNRSKSNEEGTHWWIVGDPFFEKMHLDNLKLNFICFQVRIFVKSGKFLTAFLARKLKLLN